MAQQAAPVDRRFTTDLTIGSFALSDEERNNVNDGFDFFLQNDDTLRRLLHYGDYRGLGRTFNDAWGNLNTSPCASWKYMETTIGNQEGRLGRRTSMVLTSGRTTCPSSMSTIMEKLSLGILWVSMLRG
jgi:hypothetical protein